MSTPSQQALPQGAAAGTTSRTRLLTEAMVWLSVGHLTTDLFSATVPTLQPVLTERFSMSLAQAGVLGGVFMFSSSVLQLPFGILSDKLQSRAFSIVGPLAAGIFLSSLSWAESYGMLLALVFLGGMGVAAFHPQSTGEASRLSGERKGVGVAVFITAGTFGLACGPPYMAAIIANFGFDRLPLAMILAVVVCVMMFLRLPAPPAHAVANRRIDWAVLSAVRKPLTVLYVLVVIRSMVQLGVAQFLTLYLTRERGFSIEAASFSLALFFLAAATGSLAGGHLADRVGGARVVQLSMIGSVPFFVLFLMADSWLSLAGLFIGGMVLLMTIPVNVVMAQELAPTQRGIVTSLMMGFAWGLAGMVFIPLVGWIADRTGIEAVFYGVSLLPLVGFALSFALPKDGPATAS
ncbi:MAG: MFS transporter [Acidobacteria bacterium]|nr:MFS transporter [Acidobacteriota bacterium]